MNAMTCDGCGRLLSGAVTNVGDSMEVILFGPCCYDPEAVEGSPS